MEEEKANTQMEEENLHTEQRVTEFDKVKFLYLAHHLLYYIIMLTLPLQHLQV